MKKMKEAMIIGNPEEVHVRLQEVQARYGADELMLVTITHDPADRLKSYELVAEKCKNKSQMSALIFYARNSTQISAEMLL